MINPIKPQEKKEVVEKDILSDQAFKEIITEVYDIMLGYSRIRKQYLTKNNPILIGNVEFWFSTTDDGVQQIRYNRPPQSWNEGLIRADLDLHFHGLYFKSHH